MGMRYRKHKYQLITVVFCLAAVMLWGRETWASEWNAPIEANGMLPDETENAWEDDTTMRHRAEWGQDVSLKGLYDSSSLYVQMGKWNVREAVLELQMSASPLLNREVSYVTVSLDGQPVEVLRLPDGETGIITYRIALPAEAMQKEGWYRITLDAYLRGQTTDACVDDSALSTWLNLFADSVVELRYTAMPLQENIEGFYGKFTSIEALENESCIAAVGRGTSDSVLTAMAYILSGIADHAAGEYGNIRTGWIEKEQDIGQADYLLYADRYENLPTGLVQEMSGIQRQYAQESAVICLLTYHQTKILLITGSDDAALINAGRLLSNREETQVLKGIQKQVGGNEDYKEPEYGWEEYIPLTEEGKQVQGNFEQSASFILDAPTDRRLAESAQLSLEYRYSVNIDFEKSLLTVYVNQVPIGSRVLTNEGADGTTEIFSIPEEANASGSITVETKFALYPEGDWCEKTPEEIPWAYVSKDSMLKWTTVEQTEVFFEYYPFPFIRNGAFADVKILLPSQWGEADYMTMAETVLTMGGWVKSNSGEVEVLSDILLHEELGDCQIISIGSSGNNQWNTENLNLTEHIGYAGLLLSQDKDVQQAAMVITGKTDSDMRKVMAYLGNRSGLNDIRGDWLLTDGEDAVCSYIRAPKQKTAAPEISRRAVTENDVPFIIVCSVLILMLLSAAMLVIKYGRKRDER